MKPIALLLSLALSTPVDAALYVPPKPAPSDTYRAQRELVMKMNSLFPDVRVHVVWAPCGQENSFYFPEEQAILLCTEFEADPGMALFVAAHEMGHALTEQITSTASEQDADELAALAMVKFGYRTELMEAALWFRSRANQEHEGGDTHPGFGFRAWELSCIEAGSEGQSPECTALYRGLRVRWNARLRNP
jgi:hypothetical protein